MCVCVSVILFRVILLWLLLLLSQVVLCFVLCSCVPLSLLTATVLPFAESVFGIQMPLLLQDLACDFLSGFGLKFSLSLSFSQTHTQFRWLYFFVIPFRRLCVSFQACFFLFYSDLLLFRLLLFEFGFFFLPIFASGISSTNTESGSFYYFFIVLVCIYSLSQFRTLFFFFCSPFSRVHNEEWKYHR